MRPSLGRRIIGRPAAGRTVYDFNHLELALREGLSLATLDKNLAEAARDEGVQSIA